jgi:hypothetical protein
MMVDPMIGIKEMIFNTNSIVPLNPNHSGAVGCSSFRSHKGQIGGKIVARYPVLKGSAPKFELVR